MSHVLHEERPNMKGSKEVIDVLNAALAGELTAINQYSLHAQMQKNRGYTALAERTRKQSLDEMEHAEALLERILHLEGVPALQMVAPPQIGQSVTEQLQKDLALEHHAVKDLNDGIATARKEGDNTSAELLVRILADEEKHVGWIQTQLGLIEKLGENTYLIGQLRG